MQKKHGPLDPKEVARLLRADGWFVKRKGPGDHVQYAHASKPGKVTLDTGADPIPTRHSPVDLSASRMGMVTHPGSLLLGG